MGEDSPSGEQKAMWFAPTLHLSFLRHLLALKGFCDFISTTVFNSDVHLPRMA